MKLQLIHIDNYLVAVDDSNYYDEYYLNKVDMRIYKRDGGGNIPTVGGVWHKKITHHLPINNAPVLEGIELLPPLEDEAEKFAESEYPTTIDSFNDKGWDESVSLRTACEIGYNKAKEKYFKSIPDWVYTRLCVYDKRNPDYLPYDEDDLTKKPTNCSCDNCFLDRTKMAEFIIQSLQQPKYPVAFECEIDNILSYNADDGINALVNPNFGKHKTITNSQGLTQLVGKYIYL
jgi:hypothetical protein